MHVEGRGRSQRCFYDGCHRITCAAARLEHMPLGGVAAQDLKTRLQKNVSDGHSRGLQRTRQCFSGCPVTARQGAPGGEGEAADKKGLEGRTGAATGGRCCIVNAVLQRAGHDAGGDGLLLGAALVAADVTGTESKLWW
jgi:hypothetical protein